MIKNENYILLEQLIVIHNSETIYIIDQGFNPQYIKSTTNKKGGVNVPIPQKTVLNIRYITNKMVDCSVIIWKNYSVLLKIRINKNNNKLILANKNSKHLEMIFKKWRDIVKQAFSDYIWQTEEQNDKFLCCVQKDMWKDYDHDIICNHDIGRKVYYDD